MTLESVLYLIIWVLLCVGFFALVMWGGDKIITKLAPEGWKVWLRGGLCIFLLVALAFVVLHFVQGGGSPAFLRFERLK